MSRIVRRTGQSSGAGLARKVIGGLYGQRSPPRDEAGVVLEQAVVDLRDDELDGTSACAKVIPG